MGAGVAVVFAIGEPLKIIWINVALPKAGEVLIKVTRTDGCRRPPTFE